ncbi:hypothetical protein GL58_18625 [Comamonas testosteroni]|uniref:Uncharacterized protein n=1 Tax=Comamonas testosteroni TaxID=285 RepID=A0A0L7MC65_COMTE|nr:hypothetical protein [Comamonas testosteroni]KOC19228.1 hypothetical protein GL58_18625 [Comamonas testosteroni]KWT72866.1 hypothetical protein APV28_1430 [Comamonas testosteroni]
MSHRHFYKPGLKRGSNPLMVFNQHNSKLTPAEVAETMGSLRTAFAHMREGVATHSEYVVLHSNMLIAQEIEQMGVVRGLQEHITAALQACASYQERSGYAESWRPSDIHFHELDALGSMLDLHEFQLQQLTAREVHQATQRLVARTKSAGGDVYQADNSMATLTTYKQEQRKRA